MDKTIDEASLVPRNYKNLENYLKMKLCLLNSAHSNKSENTLLICSTHYSEKVEFLAIN